MLNANYTNITLMAMQTGPVSVAARNLIRCRLEQLSDRSVTGDLTPDEVVFLNNVSVLRHQKTDMETLAERLLIQDINAKTEKLRRGESI